MEIIFIPKGLSEDLMNFQLEEIASNEFEEIKKELERIDKNYKLKAENFGTGADWYMVLAILSTGLHLLVLGDKIEKGIDGWIKIGKRFKNIFSKTDQAYIDIDLAKILALNHISSKFKITSIEIIQETELPVKYLCGMLTDRSPNDFIAKPFCVYFLTFEVNEKELITLGVRSDGEIKELYNFNTHNFSPF